VLSAVCIVTVRASASGDIAASNQLAKPRFRDLHRLVGPDDHVGGFEITVDDAARMSGGERDRNPQRLVQAHRGMSASRLFSLAAGRTPSR
jgi:hypothetical protein